MMRLKTFNFAALASILIAPMQAHAMQCPTAVRGQLDSVGEGRRVYLEFNCAGCHGNQAGGGMGPSIKGAEQGDIQEAVLNGDAREGGMPSFKGCATKTDANNIGAYLKSIGKQNEPVWLDWWNLNP
ncbi:MAG TPA: c-type cytochrome [Rhizomicrobium sp.]|jgi:mono/diheme cytochrome c family protein|nr:c-type cytochrome [Rhizomicrobium sp.]